AFNLFLVLLLMRKLSGILFLLIMLFNLAGISIIFTFQKARIRREMKSHIKKGVPRDNLHVITFSHSRARNIHWTRKNKEFILQGEMYDVVSSTRDSNYVHYYCLNDQEEKELFLQLDYLVQKKMKEDRRSGKNAGKILRAMSNLVYLPTEDLASFETSALSVRYFDRFNASISSPYLEYITPPPRLS